MNNQQNDAGFFGRVNSWLATPFQSNGSALKWVLFVGLILVAVWFWNVILYDLSREVRAMEAAA